MNKRFALRLSIAAMISASLIGCATNAPVGDKAAPVATASTTTGSPLKGVTLSGVVADASSVASITVIDAQGARKTATSDAAGRYTLSADGLVAPLLLVAEAGGRQYVAVTANPAGAASANINALTDYVASAIATSAKLDGPISLINAGKAPAVSAADIKTKNALLQPLVGAALKDAGVTEADFDPVSSKAAGVATVLKLVRHNRGYLSSKGVLGNTALFDYNFHEITEFSPLKLAAAQAEQQLIQAPGTTRIFIAGDSTASNYDVEVKPRMGWGQAFDRQVKDPSFKVVNVAQSGRSSRSFITEGWFGMIEKEIRKGDYLLVQFGHNDEKCGYEPPRPAPARDGIDIANLCTYPGAAAGVPAEMSFQKTLEKYIAIAKKVGATPVLITPVTRRAFKDGKIGETTHTWGRGKVPGDYSQTIRDTAKANKVALVDLDARSMAFFNSVGEAESLNYYLAVDPAVYPYYAKNTGSKTKPDNTHFQEKGAEAIGKLVADGLKEAKLPIADKLK